MIMFEAHFRAIEITTELAYLIKLSETLSNEVNHLEGTYRLVKTGLKEAFLCTQEAFLKALMVYFCPCESFFVEFYIKISK